MLVLPPSKHAILCDDKSKDCSSGGVACLTSDLDKPSKMSTDTRMLNALVSQGVASVEIPVRQTDTLGYRQAILAVLSRNPAMRITLRAAGPATQKTCEQLERLWPGQVTQARTPLSKIMVLVPVIEQGAASAEPV